MEKEENQTPCQRRSYADSVAGGVLASYGKVEERKKKEAKQEFFRNNVNDDASSR